MEGWRDVIPSVSGHLCLSKLDGLKKIGSYYNIFRGYSRSRMKEVVVVMTLVFFSSLLRLLRSFHS